MLAAFARHPVTKGLLGGMIGVALALGVFHLYVDHEYLHAIVRLVQQQQQAAAQQQQPRAMPAPTPAPVPSTK